MEKLLTDSQLRAHWSKTRSPSYTVQPGTVLTPAARDFVKEHGITLVEQPAYSKMPMAPVSTKDGTPVFVDDATGRTMTEKPEAMTHLRGNRLVPKTHPVIAFRGRLDSLCAEILWVQCLAEEAGETGVQQDLEEVRKCVLTLLSCEVRELSVPPTKLLGLTEQELRTRSQQVKACLGIDHPIPDCSMGKLCIALNRLRTQVREAELSAAVAFSENGCCTRQDIIQTLNRLSSCVYLIFCRKLAGFYARGK